MTGDLTAFRDHCRKQADQDGSDPLWTQLADEVDRYLEREEDTPLC